MVRKVPQTSTYPVHQKYKDNLKVFIDPERQQKGKFANGERSNLLINYARGGIKLLSPNPYRVDTKPDDLTLKDIRCKGPRGEYTYYYESNFSSGADGWAAARGTVEGGIDDIGGENNVLKFWANDDNGTHYAYRSSVIDDAGQIYEVSGKIYIPSGNTNLKIVRIAGSSASAGYTDITTQDQWVNFKVTIVPQGPYYTLRLNGLKSDYTYSWAGANNSNNDLFYAKDIKVKRLGLVAHWVFNNKYNKEYLIYRSNFAYHVDEWNAASGTSNIITDKNGHTYLKYYANNVNITTSYHGIYHRYRPAKALGTYRVKARVFLPSSNSNLKKVTFMIVWGIDSFILDTYDEWVDIDFTVKNTESDQYLRIFGLDENNNKYFAGANDPNDDYFLINNIEMYSLGDGYVGADWSKGGPSYGDEIITNGNFDSDSSGWDYASVDHEFYEVDTNNIGRTNCAKITTNGVNNNAAYISQNCLSGLEGKTVKVQFDYYFPGSNFSKSIEIKYDNGSELIEEFVPIKDEWATKIVYAKINSSFSVNSRFYIYFDRSGTTATGDTIYLDNVSLKEISNGNHIVGENGIDIDNQLIQKPVFYHKGHALEFDGVNDKFSREGLLDPNEYLGPFTIITRVKIASSQTYSYPEIFVLGNTHKTTGVRYSTGAKKIYIEAGQSPYDGSAYKSLGVSLTDEQLRTPHTFIFTYNGTDTLKVYMDGKYINTTTTDPIKNSNVNKFYIGGYSNYFAGTIYEVAYYNIELDQRLINLTLNAGSEKIYYNNFQMLTQASVQLSHINDLTAMRVETLTTMSSKTGITINDFGSAITSLASVFAKIKYKSNTDIRLLGIYIPNSGEQLKNEVIIRGNPTNGPWRPIFFIDSTDQNKYVELHSAVFRKIYQTDDLHHGVAQNGLQSTAWGSHPAAIQLDGVNDVYDFGVYPGVHVTDGSFLLNIWINHSGSVTGKPISNGVNWEIQIHSTGEVDYYLYDLMGNWTPTGIKLTPDQWYLLSWLYDKDNGSKFLINNEEEAVDALHGIVGLPDNTHLVYGGWRDSGSAYGSFFGGKLGIMEFYNFSNAQNLPSDALDLVDHFWTNTKHKYGL